MNGTAEFEKFIDEVMSNEKGNWWKEEKQMSLTAAYPRKK
jgi:hypothetical protein